MFARAQTACCGVLRELFPAVVPSVATGLVFALIPLVLLAPGVGIYATIVVVPLAGFLMLRWYRWLL